MSNYVMLNVEKMRSFCVAVYESYGFSREESAVIADVLLRADQYGIESHGIQRMMRYHREIGIGCVDVHAKPETLFETGISAVWDAHKAMGQVVAEKAARLAIEKAEKNGVGMVTVRNSNHYGIAGYYSNMAVERDLIGVSMTNTEAICVPTGSKRAMLGTNPIALAMPADPLPFSFDAATTVVTRGKLEVYNKNEKPIPDLWTVDAQGRPCANAAEVLRNITNRLGGGIAPLGGSSPLTGGHKGYGFALMVDIFTAVLSNGLTSPHVNEVKNHNGICHWFMALDYGIFGDKAVIRKNMSTLLQELRDAEKADGESRIYTHGEPERDAQAGPFREEIPANEKTTEEIREIASIQGIPCPF
ncbi:MAG: Ldh family oxidoreductase [Synergistaceae bacterium]|jgi:LDH2 family malate/lactate/ureidoglycolate dehydrogenase|nr:Ldh family oxidoreductase [Synergistaceae bacterium]